MLVVNVNQPIPFDDRRVLMRRGYYCGVANINAIERYVVRDYCDGSLHLMATANRELQRDESGPDAGAE